MQIWRSEAKVREKMQKAWKALFDLKFTQNVQSELK